MILIGKILLMIWLVAVGVVVYGLATTQQPSSTQAGTEIARLELARGSVQTRQATAPVWIDSVPQQRLALGDFVATGRQSQALIHFDDGTILRLGEDALVQIQDSPSADDAIVHLIRGEVQATREIPKKPRGEGTPRSIIMQSSRNDVYRPTVGSVATLTHTPGKPPRPIQVAHPDNPAVEVTRPAAAPPKQTALALQPTPVTTTTPSLDPTPQDLARIVPRLALPGRIHLWTRLSQDAARNREDGEVTRVTFSLPDSVWQPLKRRWPMAQIRVRLVFDSAAKVPDLDPRNDREFALPWRHALRASSRLAGPIPTSRLRFRLESSLEIGRGRTFPLPDSPSYEIDLHFMNDPSPGESILVELDKVAWRDPSDTTIVRTPADADAKLPFAIHLATPSDLVHLFPIVASARTLRITRIPFSARSKGPFLCDASRIRALVAAPEEARPRALKTVQHALNTQLTYIGPPSAYIGLWESTEPRFPERLRIATRNDPTIYVASHDGFFPVRTRFLSTEEAVEQFVREEGIAIFRQPVTIVTLDKD